MASTDNTIQNEDLDVADSTIESTPEQPKSTKDSHKDNIQDLLTSKIAEIENGNAKEDEEERKLVKRHMKEVKQALDALPTVDERFKTLNAKYMQLYYENRKGDREKENLKRKTEQAGKDKDTINSELTKANNMKAKLEALCRELQRQNKQVLEDSKRVAADEQQKRQDLSKKFHTTIKEITTKMEEQGEERLKQLKENEMLREKLKNFAEQYEIREQHFATQIKAKDLERQLLEAKLKQQADIALQEALKAQAYKEQITTLAKTENELRAQLALYAEKFEQFQDTLTKSNDVFTTFKQEMERMTKTIKRLEKENGGLKKKTEQTDITLIELAEERNNYRKQVELLKTQKQKLEGLCRALQAERQTTSNGDSPPSSGIAETKPEPKTDIKPE